MRISGKLCLVMSLGLCVTGAICQMAGQQASSAAPTSGAASTNSPIRQVDFRNFSYPTSCSEGDTRFPAAIPVKNGGWGPANKSDNNSYWVNAPFYGRLLGGNEEQAVILGDCSLGNGDEDEIFVYGMRAGKPQLIQLIKYPDWAPDRDSYDVTSIAIKNDKLLVTYTAGGNHAQPAWSVTRVMIWNGGKFVSGPATRKPYKP